MKKDSVTNIVVQKQFITRYCPFLLSGKGARKANYIPHEVSCPFG